MIFKKITPELEAIFLTEDEFKEEKSTSENLYGVAYIMLGKPKNGEEELILLPTTHIKKSSIINYTPVQSIIDDERREAGNI